MNWDTLGWSEWTGILWRFRNFHNREQIGVCGTAGSPFRNDEMYPETRRNTIFSQFDAELRSSDFVYLLDYLEMSYHNNRNSNVCPS